MAENNNASLATKLKSSQEYLDELKQLSEDPQYNRGVPDDTRKTLREAISSAENLYKQKASQNEWLEIAQTLGQAATQFGAAQAGMKSGRDMSNLPLNKGVDYSARTDQNFREYQQSLSNAGKNAELDRDRFVDEAKGRENDMARHRDYLGEALKTSRENEQNISREHREDNQSKKSTERENQREADTILRMNMQELNTQEKSLAEKLKSAQNVSNIYSQMDDADKRNLGKLQMTLGPEASKADINLASLKSELEARSKPGVINRLTGGLIATQNPDKEAQQGVLDGKVSEIKNLLDSVRARKQELLSGTSTQGTSGTTGETGGGGRKDASPPPADPNVFDSAQLATYAKQYNMTEDQARKYLESQGYKYAEK